MPSAEIIAIGTELLLGEIQDTNTRTLALRLRDANIDLFRATMVGDNAVRISKVITEALNRSDIVITTGGLGPTVDDPTRLAVAMAVGVETEFRPELWEQIQNRFKRFNRTATENNKRQAYIPQGAIAVENPVGTAPAFIVESGSKVVISLPGVPREMEYLIENRVIPYLKQHFQILGTIKASVLHAAGVGESQVDEWIGDLETLINPTVGLLAHPGQVDIRITAKAGSQEEADRMIEPLISQIKERLGDHVYGRDSDSLESVTQEKLAAIGWDFALMEYGMGGELYKQLKLMPGFKEPPEIYSDKCSQEDLFCHLEKSMQESRAHVGLGACYHPGPEKQELFLTIITPLGNFEMTRSYGGPPQSGISFAVNTAVDFLRRSLPSSLPKG
jgi:nicotinamide-nucleotide amidase